MKKGFILGKFYPFHKGHEALARKALEYCDSLTILVTKEVRETISGELRADWVRQTFVDEGRISVKLLHYDESELPNSSESSRDISRIWARKLKEIFPTESLIFTSEPYGDYVAEYMGIAHIFVPQQGEVRATLVRANPYKMWQSIPDAVKPYYQRKVVILGTESVGKTTLAKQLAAHYDAALALEAGRDLIPNSAKMQMADLEKVAAVHAQYIGAALSELRPLTIIDTDVHITQSYARFCLGENLFVSDEIKAANKADLYLYLCADVAFVQDGTRMSEVERDGLDASHRAVLAEANIDFCALSGNYSDRFLAAVARIDAEFPLLVVSNK
jgi:HTH-type transcriptional regulator, transcriptional repressor of NAD biosynthesis genes